MPNIAFNTGLKALLAARTALDVVGHNIANSATPGYSRQRVELGASFPLRTANFQLGTGVDVRSIRRAADELLTRRILAQVSVTGRLDTRQIVLGELESYLNEPGGGIGAVLDDFFAAVSELSAQPADKVLRKGLVSAGSDLGERFRQLVSNVQDLRDGILQDVELQLGKVNGLAAQIAALNVEIGQTELGGVVANDLRDERDRALKELATLVDVQTIEDQTGVVRVLVAGSLLVDSDDAHELRLEESQGGELSFELEGATGEVDVTGGALGGLLELHREAGPSVRADVDAIARNLILAVNRVHSTGIASGGPFTSLVGDNRVQDLDQDGQRTDELLANAGLPFAVGSGELYVDVQDLATGEFEKHRIPIDATHTTVGDLLDALDAIPHLSAELDAVGRVRVSAASGFGFDFSRRVDGHPDPAGTLGGAMPSLGTAAAGPFALADGDTLDVSVDTGSGPVAVSVAFDAADFDAIGQASAAEIAAVINADAGAQAAGLVAVVSGESLFLQASANGAASSLTVTGGSAVAALGWTPQVGLPVTGHAAAVQIEVEGVYAGAQNTVYTFRPNMDGELGVTPGLEIEVFGPSGAKLASLAVGDEYEPGTALELADDVSISFGAGQVSSSANDAFALDLVADSDTSDVLVALGLNSFFVGSNAGDIAVRADLTGDPDLLAGGVGDAAGDGQSLLDLLDVQDLDLAGLEGRTLGEAYGELVGGLGFDAASAAAGLEASAVVLTSLELRREQVAGVNVDEEMLDLMKLEQTYGAAAQFLTVMNDLHAELLEIL